MPLSQITHFLKNHNEYSTANQLLNTFSKYATTIEQHDELAKLFFDVRNYLLSLNHAKQVLALCTTKEQKSSASFNLAKVYNLLDNPEQSLKHLQYVKNIVGDEPDIQLEESFAYFLLGDKKTSERILRELLKNPSLNEKQITTVRFNLGTHDLYKGDFLQGLQGFLVEGKKLDIWNNQQIPNLPEWDGSIELKKIVYMLAEGGIGDEFINVRFSTHLKKMGMKPIWVTPRKELVDIFNRNRFEAILPSEVNVSEEAVWVFAMQIPLKLKLDITQLWDGPYFSPSITHIQKHSDKIISPKIKVGIRWAGNPMHDHDLHRSVPLSDIYNVVKDFNNLQLYSLQRDAGIEDLIYDDVEDLSQYMETYEDTFALIDKLDVVITSCTSVAHAAAALGKRTFIIVPITAYYTWASTIDESTIWYGDNVTILRQVKPRSWIEPLAQLRTYLEKV